MDAQEPSTQSRTLAGRVAALVEWAKHTRLARALGRYGQARGSLLAGGITYVAIFSVSAALAIGYTIFMWLLGGDEELRESVVQAINDALPGIIDTGDGAGGLLTPEQLVIDQAINLASIIAAAVLLWSAMSIMNSLKLALRAMFGIATPKESFPVAKVRDLVGFVALALAVLLTAVLGIAVGTAGQWVMELIGITGALAAWTLRILGLLVALLVDTAMVALLIRGLAGARVPRRDLLLGALIAGVAAGALRLLGTSVVGAVDDPLLASAAAIVTLLLWINLLAQMILIVGAWMANPPLAPAPTDPADTRYDQSPNYVTLSVPRTLLWPHHAATGLVEMRADVRDENRAADLEHAGEEAEDVLERHEEEVERRHDAERLVAERQRSDEYWGGLIGKTRDALRRRRLARARRRLDRRERQRERARRLRGE